ncbi:MAG: hypothetical protein KDJ16_07480, partial [Hyphomicrobiales bacterium]|nr:hypothetical protein [Hyphomicrobiales bacterium]
MTIDFRYRRLIVIVHDLVVTWLAVAAAFWLRFGDFVFLPEALPVLVIMATVVMAFAGIVYRYFSLYKAIWRFAST